MLCRDNVPVAKTDIAAADLHRQDRLGAGESCKHLGKQGGKLLLGKGLHEIVKRTHLKALQRVVGRGRGKNQKAVCVRFAQLLGSVHAAHPVHVNIQKRGGKALLFFCGEKALAAFKFQ